MKAAVFSVRDLSRQTAKVLSAARRLGVVRVHSRTGDSFTIRAETGEPAVAGKPDFAIHRE